MTYRPKPLVYIAGPYSSDPVAGTREAVQWAEWVECRGGAALIPHLSIVWDLISHAEPARWYDRDLHLLARCDALLRFPGDSPGADDEETFAREHAIPVFTTRRRDDIHDWLAGHWLNSRETTADEFPLSDVVPADERCERIHDAAQAALTALELDAPAQAVTALKVALEA
jgi:hypothetical protein